MKLGYPKSHRLLYRSQFKRLARLGKRYKGQWVVIELLKTESSRTQLGITVTRKFGKAVRRNRFKRLTREVFRHLYPSLPMGYQLIVRPLRSALDVTYHQLYEELEELLIHRLSI